MNRTISFFIGILLGAILGAVITQTVCIKPNKEYVYVDIDRIISTIAQDIGNSNISQDALPAKVNELKYTFEHALIAYQQAHNAIILSSKPIKGAVDKTDYFIEQLRLSSAKPISDKISSATSAQPAEGDTRPNAAVLEPTTQSVSKLTLKPLTSETSASEVLAPEVSDSDTVAQPEYKPTSSETSVESIAEPGKSASEHEPIISTIPGDGTSDNLAGGKSGLAEPTTPKAEDKSQLPESMKNE